MRLSNYISEKVKDVRWFEALPDYKPSSDILRIQKEMGLRTKWKDAGTSFKSSRYVEGVDIIAIVKGDDERKTLLHELGHATYFSLNKEWIRSLTKFIKAKYKTKVQGWSYKSFGFGDESWAYSHSGSMNEDKEIWAIMFSLYHMGFQFPEESKLKEAMEMILKK